MAQGDDLTTESLMAVLGGRPLQAHPVVLSTAVAAAAWAESDAPDGAVVVAANQIAPRGHAEKPWRPKAPGAGLGVSLVLRPELDPRREGWLYIVAAMALADVCGEGSIIEWPDEVWRGGTLAGATGTQVRLKARGVDWAVVSLWLPDALPPRGAVLAELLERIEVRRRSDPAALLEEYAPMCATIGRRVTARLLGGTGPRMRGTAVAADEAGALVLETDAGARAPLRPHDVRGVDDA
jgi:BirA family biotin operon repressor/biotin-[acetyl-CoA-carboxylase] ligase